MVITVSASDLSAGLAGAPAVTVTDAASTVTVLTASGSGPWTYTYAVTSATANGLATITATVFDQAGNSNTATGTFNVNKTQVTGSIQAQLYVGGTRTVTFAATNAGGVVLKTWSIAVSFTGDTGTYTLTDVPAATAKLSAKTAWTLRRRLAVTMDGNKQAIVTFTGNGGMLLGGDIDGSNSVNILDYGLMKTSWLTANAACDINGDGGVGYGGLRDYEVQLVPAWRSAVGPYPVRARVRPHGHSNRVRRARPGSWHKGT